MKEEGWRKEGRRKDGRKRVNIIGWIDDGMGSISTVNTNSEYQQ